MSRVTFVSPGARARGFTTDAEASAPLAPIQQLHQRLGEAEKAIAWLCLAEPDDAGGSRNPRDGEPSDGPGELIGGGAAGTMLVRGRG